MGVAGCGKSTIGKKLAAALGSGFIDGDDLHPDSNIKKMASGIPLDDSDRKPWLIRVGKEFSTNPSLVIACSALKRSYRDVIREYAPNVIFLHLTGSKSLLMDRISQRDSHYMKPEMLDSQLAILENLQKGEIGKAFDISESPEDIVKNFKDYCAKSNHR